MSRKESADVVPDRSLHPPHTRRNVARKSTAVAKLVSLTRCR